MKIETITKNGEKSKRLLRLDNHVWVQFILDFDNEEAAKSFVKEVGVSPSKIAEKVLKEAE